MIHSVAKLSVLLVFTALALILAPQVCDAAAVIYLDADGAPYAYQNPGISEVFDALEALAKPPSVIEAGVELTSAVLPGTHVLDAGVVNDVAVVNFSREIIGTGLDEVRITAVFQQVQGTLYGFGIRGDVRLLAEGKPLSEYLSPVMPITPRPEPLPVGPFPAPGSALSGKKITLSPGHGYVWNGSGWVTERPVYCSPLNQEDLHNNEIMRYLDTYLLQDGAVSIPSRCLNASYGNHSSGRPWWQMSAAYWIQHMGYPCSVYASSTGDCTLGSGASESSDSIRARPLASDYDNANIYISLHTNGLSGNCTGSSCPTGTITYYDCSTEHASYCTVSQNLASAVQNALIDVIRTKYPDSTWYNRGTGNSDGAFGEIRIPNRAAILIELAFHDTCDKDAVYLRDNFFRSSTMWAVYKGICTYFGTTPTFDYYSYEVVSHDIPSFMGTGETRTVHITLRNRGVLWTEARSFRLGAVGDSDPFTATTRQTISGEVGPSTDYTFTFNLTAPTTPGTYTTDWRMVRDGFTWFGPTVSQIVTVGTPDTEAPSVPTNLYATGVDLTSINLSWTASTDNIGVAGYKIYRNGAFIGSSAATSYTDSGLASNTSYTYRVSAYDGANNESAQSEPASAITWALVFQDGIPNISSWIADTVADGTVRGLTYDSSRNHATYTGAGSATATAGTSGTNGCMSSRTFAAPFTSGRFEGFFYDSSANNNSRQGMWLRGYNGASLTSSMYLGTYSAAPGSYSTYSAGVYTGGSWIWNGQVANRAVDWHSFRIDILPTGAGAIRFYIDETLEASQDRFANLDSYGITKATLGHNYNVNQQGWFDDLRFSAPVPNAPVMGTAEVLGTTSIRWNFTDQSDCEWSFDLQDNANVSKASAARDSSSITETGLSPNTRYIRHLHGINGTLSGPASANASACTLSVPPSPSTVTCSRSTSTWYSTPLFTFTAVGGFGVGRVEKYRYVWDQNPTHTWTGSESIWNMGTLTRTASTMGNNWYLHLQGLNADNVPNGTMDIGPFFYGLTAVWTYQTGGPVRSSPTVDNDFVFVGSDDGYLYALNALDGSLIWQTSLGAPVRSRVALYGSDLYCTATDGKIYALTTDGDIRWSTLIGGSNLTSTPAYLNGFVYVGSDDGILRKLDAATGAVLASQSLGAPITSSPSVPPDGSGMSMVIVGTDAGTACAVQTNGTEFSVRWATSLGTSAKASPSSDWSLGQTMIGSSTGMSALSSANGTLIWSTPTSGEISLASWNDRENGILYSLTSDGNVYAFNTVTGSVEAGYPASILAGPFTGAPVRIPGVSGGSYLYAASASGFFSLDTGNPLMSVGGYAGSFVSSPSVSGLDADDLIVVGCDDGKVYAFGIR